MSSRLPIVSTPAASLPTVQALDALWQEVSAKRLWAPPYIWRYLGLARRLRLRFVDARQVRVSAPAGKVSACSGCTDICCVGPKATVLLRLRDIAGLHDLGRTDLLTHEKPMFSVDQLASRPALRRQLGSRAWEIFPVLRQDSMGACTALSAAGRCTLYPHWPLACARFPYSLHLDDEEIFFSRRCQSYWIHPSGQKRVQSMVAAAVAGYNERIKDFILLTFARQQLSDLKLLSYLRPPE